MIVVKLLMSGEKKQNDINIRWQHQMELLYPSTGATPPSAYRFWNPDAVVQIEPERLTTLLVRRYKDVCHDMDLTILSGFPSIYPL